VVTSYWSLASTVLEGVCPRVSAQEYEAVNENREHAAEQCGVCGRALAYVQEGRLFTRSPVFRESTDTKVVKEAYHGFKRLF
jgi:hypothetical protein